MSTRPRIPGFSPRLSDTTGLSVSEATRLAGERAEKLRERMLSRYVGRINEELAYKFSSDSPVVRVKFPKNMLPISQEVKNGIVASFDEWKITWDESELLIGVLDR